MAWQLQGTYFENCSCDMVCPCTTSGLTMRADADRCQVVLSFHVEQGEIDGVEVGGKTVVIVADTPPVMSDGNWRVGVIMDAAASPEQAEKLGAVFAGQAGGPMAMLSPLITEMLGMESAPIDYVDDGRVHSVKVGELIDIEIEDFVPPLEPRGGGRAPDRYVSPGQFDIDHRQGQPFPGPGLRALVRQRGQERPLGAVLLGLMNTAAPSLRHLTPPASLLLLGAAGAWVGVVFVARHMGPMPGTMGLGIGPFVAIWALMMAAMMLPSVTPFASLYTRSFTDNRGLRLAALGSGYLLVWSLAAIPAYGLAWLADRAVAGHPSGATAMAVIIFAACGIYQLTPLKDRCLARCRSPLGFVLKFGSYRGRSRDLRVGLYHGAFCLACCWGLMALLVAFGLMNLAGMVVLAGIVLLEKTSPWGTRVSRALGAAALLFAVLVIFQPCLAPGLHASIPTGTMGHM